MSLLFFVIVQCMCVCFFHFFFIYEHIHSLYVFIIYPHFFHFFYSAVQKPASGHHDIYVSGDMCLPGGQCRLPQCPHTSAHDPVDCRCCCKTVYLVLICLNPKSIAVGDRIYQVTGATVFCPSCSTCNYQDCYLLL